MRPKLQLPGFFSRSWLFVQNLIDPETAKEKKLVMSEDEKE